MIAIRYFCHNYQLSSAGGSATSTADWRYSCKKVWNWLSRLNGDSLAIMPDKPQRWVCIRTPNGGHDLERLSDIDFGPCRVRKLVESDLTPANALGQCTVGKSVFLTELRWRKELVIIGELCAAGRSHFFTCK
jgi:hypothetical protein